MMSHPWLTEDVRVDAEYHGVWRRSDRGEGIRHEQPVEVPQGTTGLLVRLDYREAGDAVLDLGCFDPAGFRGWSGGARREFVVLADDATPGYLRGELPAGTWRVVLGLHRVPEAGLPWRLRVTMAGHPQETELLRERAARADTRAAEALAHALELSGDALTARQLPAPPGLRWVPGDLHAHTLHSDGQLTVDGLARLAAHRGLAFTAVTDHNTVSHHRELAAATRASGVLLVPGQEVTTDHGHANAFGDIGWIDFREPPGEWARVVRERGGLLSVNHPVSGDCSWQHVLTELPALVELWHGGWHEWPDAAPLAWWQAAAAARRAGDGPTACREPTRPVGGSDFHRPEPGSLLGTPTTWLLVAELSVAGVIEALRRGPTAVTVDAAASTAVLRVEQEILVLDGAGLLLNHPDGTRTPVRGDIERVPAAPGLYRLETHTGATRALCS